MKNPTYTSDMFLSGECRLIFQQGGPSEQSAPQEKEVPDAQKTPEQVDDIDVANSEKAERAHVAKTEVERDRLQNKQEKVEAEIQETKKEVEGDVDAMQRVQQMIDSMESETVPLEGVQTITIPETGEIVTVGFGSQEAESSDNDLLQKALVMAAVSNAKMKAANSLLAGKQEANESGDVVLTQGIALPPGVITHQWVDKHNPRLIHAIAVQNEDLPQDVANVAQEMEEPRVFDIEDSMKAAETEQEAVPATNEGVTDSVGGAAAAIAEEMISQGVSSAENEIASAKTNAPRSRADILIEMNDVTQEMNELHEQSEDDLENLELQIRVNELSDRKGELKKELDNLVTQSDVETFESLQKNSILTSVQKLTDDPKVKTDLEKYFLAMNGYELKEGKEGEHPSVDNINKVEVGLGAWAVNCFLFATTALNLVQDKQKNEEEKKEDTVPEESAAPEPIPELAENNAAEKQDTAAIEQEAATANNLLKEMKNSASDTLAGLLEGAKFGVDASGKSILFTLESASVENAQGQDGSILKISRQDGDLIIENTQTRDKFSLKKIGNGFAAPAKSLMSFFRASDRTPQEGSETETKGAA